MHVREGSALSERGDAFAEFVRLVETRLRRALVAAYGIDDGTEACAAALAYAWEHWDKVGAMENPAGYLYRVGQSSLRRLRRRHVLLPPVPAEELPHVEPGLPSALARLTRRQRLAVLLVHGHGLTYADVAETLRISVSSVRNHVSRGMKHLRADLGVDQDD